MKTLDCSKIEQVVGGQTDADDCEQNKDRIKVEISEWGMYIISFEHSDYRDKVYA